MKKKDIKKRKISICKKQRFVVPFLFAIILLTACGKGVPEAVEDLPALKPFMNEEQKEELEKEQEGRENAVPLTAENLQAAMAEDVKGKIPEAMHCFLPSEGESEERLQETFSDLLGEIIQTDYRIGYFLENAEYTTYVRSGVLFAEMTYTWKDKQVSYEDILPGGRCYAGEYSEEAVRQTIRDAVMRRDPELIAVFENTSDLDDEAAYRRMMELVSEEENTNEYLLYYLSSASGSAIHFGSGMLLEQIFTYNENASEDLVELDGKTELEVVREMIDRQDDWREKMVLHYSDSRDWEDLVRLAEIASANDSADMAASIDVFRTSEYTNGGGGITELECLFADGLDEMDSKKAELAEAIGAAEDALGIAGADESYSAEEAEELYWEIADYICSGTDYDYDLAEAIEENTYTEQQYYDLTAYGALVTGSTVCSGYASAFKALCDAAGLPCWVINGTAINDRSGLPNGHAWNAVLLDDEIYYIDTTYMDSGWEERYFLFQDETEDGRTRDEGWFLPW